MRASQTEGEVIAIAALAKYLSEVGFGNLQQVPEITDKPDCAFDTDQQKVSWTPTNFLQRALALMDTDQLDRQGHYKDTHRFLVI